MANGHTRTYAIQGLTCLDCAQRVQSVVERVPGVRESHADYASGRLTVSLEAPDLPADLIAKAVSSAGYTLITERSPDDGPLMGFVRFVFSRQETMLAAIAALLTLVGLALVVVGTPYWSLVAAFGAAVIVGGMPLVRNAWQELRFSHSLGINTLMVIAVVGAMFIGEATEAAIVVVLFSLGEALEGYAADRSRLALESLLDLAPPVALKLSQSGNAREVPVGQLTIGDLVLVRPGDSVSLDGIVRSGQSAVDQAPITGESMPVDKGPGDEVYAGTINTVGALHIEVSRLAADNTLSRMIELVQQAQSRQSPVQRFIDRFARVYTPTVAGLALLVAAVPPLLFGLPFTGDHGWLVRALQMLVIACPCALVISTPVALVSGMTNAASRGVLIKGGRSLEALSRAKVFAFDKTGTLTEGRPVATDVVDTCTCGECLENCGLRHAAALEAQSSHPLAQALLAEAQARRLTVPSAQDVIVLGGRGMTGVVNGEQVTVASHAHFDEYVPHEESLCQLADELASQGKTVIMVQHNDDLCALIGAADRLRSSSGRVISSLKAKGIHTVMLTGDNPTVAQEIGRQVGVDEIRAGLLPEQKVSAIVELAQQYDVVAMVGDGVNDAPALAEANVGIAMGGAGSSQAMETADVVLMGDDLTQLPFIVWLGRKTRAIVTVNIVVALAIKVAIFALAAAGLATLWMAILADVGASVAVILNGMRLRRMSES